jgi:hypothetical protein
MHFGFQPIRSHLPADLLPIDNIHCCDRLEHRDPGKAPRIECFRVHSGAHLSSLHSSDSRSPLDVV